MSFIDQVVWASAPYPCGLKGCSVCDYGKSQHEAKAEAPPTPSKPFEDRVVDIAGVLYRNRPYAATEYTWAEALMNALDIIIASEFEETCTCD